MPGQSGSDDGLGTSASFIYPVGVAVNSAGSAYIADAKSNLIRAISGAAVTTLAGGAGGNLPGMADGVGTAATFSSPISVTLNAAGTILFVADNFNFLIRAVTLDTAVVTTLAGNFSKSTSTGLVTNGVGTSASFLAIYGIAADVSGNLFVADYSGNTIRKIVIATAVVSTLAGGGASGDAIGHANGVGTAATFAKPIGIAADSAGNVFVADTYNNVIRAIVVASGVVTTLAGGGASGNSSGYADGANSTALFTYPLCIAVDASRNKIYVTENGTARVRTVSVATGIVEKLTGSGTIGYADGPSTSAMFSQVMGVAFGGGGGDSDLLYVGDAYAQAIRIVCLAAPSPSPSASPSASSSPTPSPSTTAAGLLFRSLSSTDLVGTLVGASLSSTASEAACRIACLASPGCDAYAFSSGALAQMAANANCQPDVTAPCFLLANVTALVPNNMMASGVLSSTYS